MEYIADNLPCVDVIQFPFSILDSYRWRKQIQLAKYAGNLLYVRSVFLQGLIFKSPQDDLVQSIRASQFIEAVAETAKANNVSRAEIAYFYVRKVPEIDEVIIGC